MVFTPNFVSVCFTFFFLKKTPDYIKLSPRNLDPSLKVHRCPWNVRGTLWQTHMLSFSLCFPASGLRDFCLSHAADQSGERGPAGTRCLLRPQLHGDHPHHCPGRQRGSSFLPRPHDGDPAGEHLRGQRAVDAERHRPRFPAASNRQVGPRLRRQSARQAQVAFLFRLQGLGVRSQTTIKLNLLTIWVSGTNMS